MLNHNKNHKHQQWVCLLEFWFHYFKYMLFLFIFCSFYVFISVFLFIYSSLLIGLLLISLIFFLYFISFIHSCLFFFVCLFFVPIVKSSWWKFVSRYCYWKFRIEDVSFFIILYFYGFYCFWRNIVYYFT